MKKIVVVVLLAITSFARAQQKVIQLYNGAAPGTENWTWQEKEKMSKIFNTEIVYNVTQPTLTVFLPEKSIANGTAVVICPGGGFHVLSIESEGFEVARWLNKKGVAAFVLKYRLVHTLTENPENEFIAKIGNQKKFEEEVSPIVSMAITDGANAISYVRQHATEWGIDPQRIGLMGFSAGGTVTTSIAYTHTAESRPDFVAPIYAYTGSLPKTEVPKDAAPMFIAAASDDALVPVPAHSLVIYNDWIAAKHTAELHIYAKGSHGFGMRKQNFPSDHWIDRFGDWLESQGLLKKK
jgi:acetyl esterase/lipase